MERVLVIGGAGFIGSHTVEALLAEGATVRVLDNLSAGKADNLPLDNSSLEFVEGDIRDADTVASALNGVSHCLHLAAQVSVVNSLEDPRNSADQNILGFVTVLEAARRADVTRFVYASSAAVYGDPVELPLTENVEPRPLSPYSVEKWVNEHYANLFQHLYDVSALGLRYFNVYGPRQDSKSPYAGVIALFVDRIREKMPLSVFGDGRQTRDFIYVGDVARANMAALRGDATGVSNVATGHTVTLLELIATLDKLCGVKSDVNFLPPREGDIAHSAGDPSHMHEVLNMKAETALSAGLSNLLFS
ncbi:MAG: NAD-dependent epimerase/dehydratase family protein [Gammaproteobacteria bacterium]